MPSYDWDQPAVWDREIRRVIFYNPASRCTHAPGCGKHPDYRISYKFWVRRRDRVPHPGVSSKAACREHAEKFAKRWNIPMPEKIS